VDDRRVVGAHLRVERRHDDGDLVGVELQDRLPQGLDIEGPGGVPAESAR
jgi:hypothetical protein